MAAGGLGARAAAAGRPVGGGEGVLSSHVEAKAAAAAPSAAPPNSPEAKRRGVGSDKGSPEGDIDRLVSVEGA